MDQSGYGQFCPVAMASEIVCTRWTALLLRELLCGNSRFNDLRKGLPRMSPTLLSKRLKELEEQGIVAQVKDARTGIGEYHLTEAGEDLRPIVMALGVWGQRWVDSKVSLRNLDPTLLMWDMRRSINPEPLPKQRVTVQFTYPDAAPNHRDYWLVVEATGETDICQVDPGHEVNLFVVCPLRSMTAIWMGVSTVATETEKGQLSIDGDRGIARNMQQWLGLSPFAKEKSRRSQQAGTAA